MIKQNKNTSAIWGRIASAFSACVLLFSLFSLPSFADPSNFSDQPIPVYTGDISYSDASSSSLVFQLGHVTPSAEDNDFFCYSSNDDIYVFFSGSRIVFASESDNAYYRVGYRRTDTETLFLYPSYHTQTFDESSGLYYNSLYNSGFVSTGACPSYVSISDGLSSVRTAVNSSSSATNNPSVLTIAPICDLTADSFNSSGFIFSFLSSSPDSNRTIIGSYYDGSELVLVAGFLTDTQFFTVRSYNPSTSSNDLVYRTYNGELRSGAISTSLVPEGLNIGYRSSSRTSTTTQLGQVFSSPEDGFRACASLFDSYAPSSASAALLPYYESSNYLAGLNSNNQSVYFTSYFPNNSALAFFKSGSLFVPIIVGKDAYGVSSIINGTETPLNRYEISFNGSSYFGYSAPLLSSIADSSLGYFSTESSAISACVNLLLSSFPSEGRRNVLYYMPSGNIAYVHVTDYSTQALLNVHLDNPISSSSFLLIYFAIWIS